MHFCARKIARTRTFDTAPALAIAYGKLRIAGLQTQDSWEPPQVQPQKAGRIILFLLQIPI